MNSSRCFDLSVENIFAASLIVRDEGNLEVKKKLIMEFIKCDEPIRFELDKSSGWLFVYSTWFECIGPQVAITLLELFTKLNVDAWFVSFSPPSEAFVIQQTGGRLQAVGVGLWDFDHRKNNFAVIAGDPCAPWTDRQELLNAVITAFVIDGICAERVSMGYDSQTASGRISDADTLHYGRRPKANPPGSRKINCESGGEVHVADISGIHSFSRETLLHLGVFSSDLVGYSVSMADSSGIQMLEDFTATRYLITTTRVRGQLKIEGVDYYLDSSEQVFQFIPGVEVNIAPDAELMEAIIIRERHVPPDYERFVPESSAITINDTGIKCLAPGAYVFEHSQRRSPWDKRPSEWNIDSISGLQEPFPSIAVSRRSAKLNCEHSINFVKIRKEERTHLHPSFIEFYYCAAGAIDLTVFIRGRNKTIHIKQGEFAVVREGVPHLVDKVFGDENGCFQQICLQLPSRFHYPFYQTKRNYIPEEL